MATSAAPEPGSARPTSTRKDEHLAAVLGRDVGSGLSTGLDRWRLRHRALPGLDLADVDLATTLWGRPVLAPLLISCMTGGSAGVAAVNANLARAAEGNGVALGLGSIRAALEDPALLATFDVRALAPTVPLLANTGAVAVDVDAVLRACDALEVDALVVHLNPLQEALQPEGTAAFARALDTVETLVHRSPRPVIAKEVGFGLSPDDVAQLLAVGCAAVDVAGAGGTNWALVEGSRAASRPGLASAFRSWGTPTAEALVEAVAVRDRDAPAALVVASGGIGDGVEAATALCLGADVVGLGRRWIGAGVSSPEAAMEAIGVVVDQLRIACFAVGASCRGDLDASKLRDRRPSAG